MSELRRRYSIRFKIEADDFDSFLCVLREVYLELDNERTGRLNKIDLISAGQDFSFSVFGVQKPEITPEVYRKKLEAYVSEQIMKAENK